MRVAVAVVAWVVAQLAASAGAATSGDLCPGASNPCVVACATAHVDADVVLDFGQCDLVFAATARVRIRSGVTLRVVANSVRLAAGALLDGTGTTQAPGGIVRLEPAGPLTIEPGAAVRVPGSHGGTILVRSGGDATLGGTLAATALAASGHGGYVSVTAGGAITVSTGIDVSGGTGDGGDIDLDGASVAVNAPLTLDGASPGGGGGDVSLNASHGPLTIDAAISADGARGTVNTGGGNGGDMTIAATGPLRVGAAASLSSTGGAPDGDGGHIDADTDVNMIVQGPMTVSAVGTGSGGAISLTAGTTLAASAALSATGGSGGDVDLIAGPTATATVTAPIDVGSTGGDGDGGGITVTGGSVVVSTVLAANADTRRDIGGSVSLTGCAVTFATSGELDAKGVSGLTLVQGSGTMVLSGTLNAAPSGTNRIEYRTVPPSLSLRGANPTPTVVRNALLTACPGTATTTTTTSRPTTTSVTTTTRPPSTTTTTVVVPPATSTTTIKVTTSTVAVSSTTVTPVTTSSTSTLGPTSTTRPSACTPADCDDADPCTFDACTDGTCTHTPLDGIDAVSCRLDALVSDVSAEPVGRTTATIRERLLGKIGAIRRTVERARFPGRRQITFLSRADRRLRALAQFVDKARVLGRLDPDLAATVTTLIGDARAAIAALR